MKRKTKRAVKKRHSAKRLQPETSISFFVSLLQNQPEAVERRPRRARATDQWEPYPGRNWDLEEYNYRQGISPRIYIHGGNRVIADGQEVSWSVARRLVAAIRLARQKRRVVRIPAGGSGHPEYVTTISGPDVLVGCRHFRWDEIERFARAQGWIK